MDDTHPLPRTSEPASRALADVGITTLGELRERVVRDGGFEQLAALHGVGPKAITILRGVVAPLTPETAPPEIAPSE